MEYGYSGVGQPNKFWPWPTYLDPREGEIPPVYLIELSTPSGSKFTHRPPRVSWREPGMKGAPTLTPPCTRSQDRLVQLRVGR